ncbi:MAG: 2-C-methyl-D-erythritol 4-phosphate cytidylyltransferase [Desulfovibrionales bacterium]
MNTWVILLAAGKSTRMTEAGVPEPKQFLRWKGDPVFWHSAAAFASVPKIQGIVFVFPEREFESSAKIASKLLHSRCPGIAWKLVPGGKLRQDSVYQGLQALPLECDTVLVHDAARPFLSADLIARTVSALEEGKTAVIPTLPVKDTIKELSGERVAGTLERKRLAAVQTPQGFSRRLLLRAHEAAAENKWTVTDDASMVERLGEPVFCIPGEEGNMKITTPHDLQGLQPSSPDPAGFSPCFGWGYDVHRFAPDGRPLVLGGVPIQAGPRVAAHSDGDVLLHALCDALLGCIGRGDIGLLFPDTDPNLDGISSGILLSEVLDLVRRNSVQITHVDLTIISQIPRIGPHREGIRKNIAALLQLPQEQVNLKATTEEGLGFTGEKKGIKAVAAVSGLRTSPVTE